MHGSHRSRQRSVADLRRIAYEIIGHKVVLLVAAMQQPLYVEPSAMADRQRHQQLQLLQWLLQQRQQPQQQQLPQHHLHQHSLRPTIAVEI